MTTDDASRAAARQLLPRDAYTSAEWFEREQNELFSRCWSFAGLTTDVAEQGDYRCVQAGRYPLFIVRDADGAIRAFHNLCRHRGSVILDGEGRAKSGLRCRYHYWTYNLDGSLRSLPLEKELFPDLERGAHALKPASVDFYGDAIFVHPDPEPAETFDAFLGPLRDCEWPHRAADMTQIARVHYDMACNWKLFFENAVDVYHLAFLHEKTLGGPRPTLADEKLTIGGRHMLYSNPDGSSASRASSGLIPIHDESARAYPNIYFFFPSFFALPSEGMFLTSEIVPIDARNTRMTGRAFCAPGAEANALRIMQGLFPLPGHEYSGEGTIGPITVRNIEGDPMSSGNFQLEDMWVCERMQLAMESPAYEAGQLALAGETGVTKLQRNVLDFVPLHDGS